MPRRFVTPVVTQVGERLAALVTLLIDLPVAPDLDVQRLRQRVDDGDADAVETAGDLVGAVFLVELAAGVEHRQHDFGGGLAALVDIDRNAAAVVDHRDGVVDVERDVDLGRVAGERFVDRVVDDLVDEVVQPLRPGGADVHGWPLADGFQPFEHLDLVGAVVAGLAEPVGPFETVRTARRAAASGTSLVEAAVSGGVVGF